MSAILNAFTTSVIATDLLVVKILNPLHRYDKFEYIIYSDDSKIQRKGSFRAPIVQLRTMDMDEGKWHIKLLQNGHEWKTRDFQMHNDRQKKQSDKPNTVYFL